MNNKITTTLSEQKNPVSAYLNKGFSAYRMGLFVTGLLLTGAVFGQSASVDVSASVELETSDTLAICSIAGQRVFTPGISIVPSSGTWLADDDTSFSCFGTTGGMELTGEAELELGGTYGEPGPFTPNGDTCQFGLMIGNVVARIQTTSGETLEFIGQLEFSRVGVQATATGTLFGPTNVNARVEIAAMPDPEVPDQDCITTPITNINVVATAWITSAE